MQPSVRSVAIGKWPGILVALGIPGEYLDGRHRPCPSCGGKDRFRFDDLNGAGTFYCSHCGAGDGIELVMRVKGLDFKAAAKEIERAAGFAKPSRLKPAQSDESKARALRRLWVESKPLSSGDEATRYLQGRGLIIPPTKALRFHPGLHYSHGDEKGIYPALLGLVQAPDGSGASLHRIYLHDAQKAPVSTPKKLMPGLPLSGAAVRLFPVAPCLGIAEGIETALAAAEKFAVPTWAAVSATGLESWVPPEETKEVVIFSDNDGTFTGQKAAFSLAHRLAGKGLKVRVEIPHGKDWAE